MSKRLEHWDRVYSTKSVTDVSWYQPLPERSLALIGAAAPNHSTAIIDIGGGASRLVDELLGLGYYDLTVLDLSGTALERTKERLGKLAAKVCWITADVTQWTPPRTWDVWHDRAVFHFLTETKDQNAYIAALEMGTKPNSVVVMSTFALDGPERCSGLPVQRYSAATLAARMGSRFRLVAEAEERHTTPSGNIQHFIYAVLKRR